MAVTERINPDESKFTPRVDIFSGVPGIDLVHFVEIIVEHDDATLNGMPTDGVWSATLSDRDVAMQRVRFRTLHAAAHYAIRIADLADWTQGFDLIAERLKGDPDLVAAMRHAEAHAHEVDAAYPAGSIIAMGNGPSIIDDVGTLRQFMSGTPCIEWKKDEEGAHRCPTCGADPIVRYHWMSFDER